MRSPSFPAFCQTLCTLLAVTVPELSHDAFGRRRLSLLCAGLRADFVEDREGGEPLVQMRIELGALPPAHEDQLRALFSRSRRSLRLHAPEPLLVRDERTGALALQEAVALRRAQPTALCAHLWTAVEQAQSAALH